MGHSLLTVEQLMKTMFLDYQSLTAVILINTFGLLLVAVVKETVLSTCSVNGGHSPSFDYCGSASWYNY